MRDLGQVKSRYRVPRELQSCHTAIVDGYVVEGHVPVEVIRRLIAERPAIAGVAVPGMPIGSPGMEVPGRGVEAYAVIAFDEFGRREVFARYPKWEAK